jgi:hypothetical protein
LEIENPEKVRLPLRLCSHIRKGKKREVYGERGGLCWGGEQKTLDFSSVGGF